MIRMDISDSRMGDVDMIFKFAKHCYKIDLNSTEIAHIIFLFNNFTLSKAIKPLRRNKGYSVLRRENNKRIDRKTDDND